jgi:hypothetical protein
MLEKENRTILSLLNIKPSEKGFYEPDKSPVESPSVDDPPARRELRVWSRHLIFLENQETVDKAFCGDSGEAVGYARGRQDTPVTPLRRGYSNRFRTVYNLIGLEFY